MDRLNELAELRAANAALKKQIAHLNRVENTLNVILQGTADQIGHDFFESLVKYLAEALQAKYTFVGIVSEHDPNLIQTIAYWEEGRLGQNFTYKIANSPCADVIGHEVRYYPRNTWQLFPQDEELVDKKIECYIGAPLFSASGRSLGILVVLHDEIIEEAINSVPIIRTFAVRAGAELERKQAEANERAQRKLAEALHEIGLALSASLDSETVLDLLLEYLERVVPFDSATVIEVQQERTQIVRARGYDKLNVRLEALQKPRSFDVNSTPTWRAMVASKRPLVIPDVQKSDLWIFHETPYQIRSWASAPVLIGGEVVAFLSVNKLEPDFYNEEHGRRLAAFAAQAALALQNARLFAAANQREAALRTLSDLLRTMNAASNIQDTMPELATILKRATGCQRVSLAQVEEDQESFHFISITEKPPTAVQNTRLHISDTPALGAFLDGRPHLVPDITEELAYKASQILYAQGIRSYVAFPLLVDGLVKGGLSVSWATPHGYDASHLHQLEQAADVIALGLERSRLFADTRNRTQELNLFNQVISAAASGFDEQQITQMMCEQLAEYLAVDHVTLLKVNRTMSAGYVMAQHVDPKYHSLRGKKLLISDTGELMTAVIHASAPLSIEELEQFPLGNTMRQLVAKYELVSALLLPVFLRDELIAIMGIGSTRKRVFTSGEIRLISTIGEELGRILETAHLYDQLRRHAADLEERVAERTSELAEANEQLKELDSLKSQFVSDVSHELRTPVTNLKLYLDLLEHKGNALLPKYLPILQKQADRLKQLIEDILDLSRLDMGRNKPVSFVTVDLNEIVADVITAHQPRAEAAGLQLTFTPHSNLPGILAERNQLAQVVTNLLANALNYTVHGRIDLTTTLSANRKSAQLTIKDTGIGILDDDLPYLFNRFYRGQRARQSNIPGTGLGLAIAQEIIHLHNGHIEVYSNLNEGTTFHVFLPVAEMSAPGN